MASPLQVHSQINSKELEKCALHNLLLNLLLFCCIDNIISEKVFNSSGFFLLAGLLFPWLLVTELNPSRPNSVEIVTGQR